MKVGEKTLTRGGCETTVPLVEQAVSREMV